MLRNFLQVLNIYELSPLEEDFVLGERGDRVGKVPRCNNTLTIKIIAVIFLDNIFVFSGPTYG